MKRLFICFAAATILASCNLLYEVGNGVSAESNVHAGVFDGISVLGSIDVIYTQSPGEQSVTLTCDENLIGYYSIWVENNTLMVGTRHGVGVSPRVKTFVTVNSPVLNSLQIAGSGDCVITGPLASDDFICEVTGSGDVLGDVLSCVTLEASVLGSGGIAFSSVVADETVFTVTGSGSIDIGLLTAKKIEAKVAGSGDITLNCAGTRATSMPPSPGAAASTSAATPSPSSPPTSAAATSISAT